MQNKIFYIVFTIYFFMLSNVYSQTKKPEDIQHLIKVMKVQEAAEVAVFQTIEYFKQQKPLVPQSYWLGIIQNTNYDEYLQKTAMVYDKYYFST